MDWSRYVMNVISEGMVAISKRRFPSIRNQEPQKHLEEFTEAECVALPNIIIPYRTEMCLLDDEIELCFEDGTKLKIRWSVENASGIR